MKRISRSFAGARFLRCNLPYAALPSVQAGLSHLRSPGHQNLITRHGPLDVLGTIGRGLNYEDILPHSIEMEVAEGLRIRVLDLATIIALKEELRGEKDLAVLPILRRTLIEKQRGLDEPADRNA